MELSLFSQVAEKQGKKVSVRALKIKDYEVETVSPMELLEGYDTLRALTFSSSLKMVESLFRLGYEKAELIISLPADFTKAREFAFLKRLEEEKEGLAKGSLLLDLSLYYYPKSHSKFYLLEGMRGKRLILGSLNFSLSAWTGKQREEVFYTDREDLIELYEKIYEEIKRNSRKVITAKEVKKEAEKVEKKMLSIEELTATPENLEAIREYGDVIDGIVAKNFVMTITPEQIKMQADREKSLTEKVAGKVTKLTSLSKKGLLLKPKELGESIRDGEVSKSLTWDGEGWKVAELLTVSAELEDAVENLRLLAEITSRLREHGGEKTGKMLLEAVLFAFAGAYLWRVRGEEDVLPENYPVFGLLAGTSKAGKSLTLSVISMLTHGENAVFEYGKRILFKGHEYKLGNSGANLFEYYFNGDFPFCKGVYPLLVNEITESHIIKDKKLYGIIKSVSNLKLPKQHGVAIGSMNVSFCMPPEIARRVFFLEYGFSLREHKKLNAKLKPLLKGLNTALFFYYLKRLDPFRVSVSPDDPLLHVREFFSFLADKGGIALPLSETYLGDIESKAKSELKHVISLKGELKVVKHPDKGIDCYVVEKEAFRYPPPVEVTVEDKGGYYYLNKKKVDTIVKRKRFWFF